MRAAMTKGKAICCLWNSRLTQSWIVASTMESVSWLSMSWNWWGKTEFDYHASRRGKWCVIQVGRRIHGEYKSLENSNIISGSTAFDVEVFKDSRNFIFMTDGECDTFKRYSYPIFSEEINNWLNALNPFICTHRPLDFSCLAVITIRRNEHFLPAVLIVSCCVQNGIRLVTAVPRKKMNDVNNILMIGNLFYLANEIFYICVLYVCKIYYFHFNVLHKTIFVILF